MMMTMMIIFSDLGSAAPFLTISIQRSTISVQEQWFTAGAFNDEAATDDNDYDLFRCWQCSTMSIQCSTILGAVVYCRCFQCHHDEAANDDNDHNLFRCWQCKTISHNFNSVQHHFCAGVSSGSLQVLSMMIMVMLI